MQPWPRPGSGWPPWPGSRCGTRRGAQQRVELVAARLDGVGERRHRAAATARVAPSSSSAHVAAVFREDVRPAVVEGERDVVADGDRRIRLFVPDASSRRPPPHRSPSRRARGSAPSRGSVSAGEAIRRCSGRRPRRAPSPAACSSALSRTPIAVGDRLSANPEPTNRQPPSARSNVPETRFIGEAEERGDERVGRSVVASAGLPTCCTPERMTAIRCPSSSPRLVVGDDGRGHPGRWWRPRLGAWIRSWASRFERLVHQERLRLADDRPRQRHRAVRRRAARGSDRAGSRAPRIPAALRTDSPISRLGRRAICSGKAMFLKTVMCG